ncbi:hypothetical protein D3C77_270060 [compost metagenome]
MVAAVVDEVHVLFLQLGDQGGEVLVPGGDAFECHYLDASLVQSSLDAGGDAFTVLLLVVDDGHALGFDLLDDVLGGGRALVAVQANGAHGQLVATLGDLGVGGGRGHHQHTFIFIDVGGGQGVV